MTRSEPATAMAEAATCDVLAEIRTGSLAARVNIRPKAAAGGAVAACCSAARALGGVERLGFKRRPVTRTNEKVRQARTSPGAATQVFSVRGAFLASAWI